MLACGLAHQKLQTEDFELIEVVAIIVEDCCYSL